MNPGHPACLALRMALAGRPGARVAVLALGIDVGALAFGAGRCQAWQMVAAMGLALAGCVVAASMSLRAQARRRELATLRVLGMSRCCLVLMLELEALWISGIGTLLGLLGSGAAERIAALWPARPGEPAALIGAGSGIPLLAGICSIAGVTVLAALLPALHAARRDVALALALLPPHQDG